LVTVPVLYLGGITLGLSIYLTYASDPSITGRYGLELAPMLVMALVAALRGAWLIRCLWILGLTTLTFSMYFMVVT
jgi:hypothetical protein